MTLAYLLAIYRVCYVAKKEKERENTQKWENEINTLTKTSERNLILTLTLEIEKFEIWKKNNK